MGEKSRDNWLVSWCSLKPKCKGKCGKCVRKSEWKGKKR